MNLATPYLKNIFSENRPATSRCKDVLIIDSNQITSNRIKRALINLDNNCIGITSDFLSAEKLINKTKPNYIIINSDLKGDFNGMQTAKIISLDYEIPIFMLGNVEDPLFLQSIKEINPRGFLFLNYSDDELKEKLIELVV